MILYLLFFLIMLCAIIALFMNLAPSFGGNPTSAQKESYKNFDNYVGGKFVNAIPTSMFSSSSDFSSAIKNSEVSAKDRNPDAQISVDPIDWNKIKGEKDSLTWLGHSAFLLSMDNKKMLIDPMLGPIASPVSFAGPKRYK